MKRKRRILYICTMLGVVSWVSATLGAQEPAPGVVPATTVTSVAPAVLPSSNQSNSLAKAKPTILKILVQIPRSIDDDVANTVDPIQAILKQSLANSLVAGSFDYKLVEQIPSDSTYLQEAKKKEIQALLSFDYFREGKRITLIAKVYDVWEGRFLAGGMRATGDDISLISTTNELLSEVFSQLDKEKTRLLANWGINGSNVLSQELTISGSQEGVLVSLDGGASLGTVVDGKIVLPFRPLALGNATRLRLEKPGYYPQTYDFSVQVGQPKVDLPPLYPRSTWGALVQLDPNMIFGSEERPAPLDFGMNLSARYFPEPDWWYLRLNYGLKRIKSAVQGSNIKVPDWTMHEISFSTALAIMPPDWIFRVYAGIGLGFYLTSVDTGSNFTDPWIELPALCLELNIHPFILDLDLGTTFILKTGNNLLPEGMANSFGLIRMGVGVKW